MGLGTEEQGLWLEPATCHREAALPWPGSCSCHGRVSLLVSQQPRGGSRDRAQSRGWRAETPRCSGSGPAAACASLCSALLCSPEPDTWAKGQAHLEG